MLRHRVPKAGPVRLSLATLALFVPASAAAHSFWLQPVDHTPEPGEEVLIAFKVGDAEDVSDWDLYWERIASFRLHGPEGAITDQQRAVRTTGAGEPGSAAVRLIGEGTHVLAFESNPSFSDLIAQRFDAYVAHEGLKAIAAHRAATGTLSKNGTELYARRAKALFQVGAARTVNVTRPIGQTLEIVPLQNPFALADGAPLDLQVFWRGEPLAGAQLFASPLNAPGYDEAFTTSADGVARVDHPGTSAMLYSVVWGEPAPNDARADYFTIFASLTVRRD